MDRKRKAGGGFADFLGDERGTVSIEFVIVLPLLFVAVFSIIESGWLMTKFMMLDRAVDMTVRELRLGAIPDVTHDELKDRICDRSIIFADCREVLALDLSPVTAAAGFGTGIGQTFATQATCVDRTDPDMEPSVTINPGTNGQNMLVRACIVVDPLLPGMGIGLRLPKDASGGFRMIAVSAYRNEPA